MKNALYTISALTYILYFITLGRNEMVGLTFFIIAVIMSVGGMIIYKIDMLEKKLKNKEDEKELD